jgi:hypothetical protein
MHALSIACCRAELEHQCVRRRGAAQKPANLPRASALREAPIAAA